MSQPETRIRHSARLALRLLLRDWKAGELTVLAVALLVAVSALTAVAFLTDRVGQAVERRAAESLAADLRLASAGEINDEFASLAERAGLEVARTTSMPSVVFVATQNSDGANTLAGINAVSESYPLRGQLKTSPQLLGEVSITDHVPPPGEAWASPRLLARLGADTGIQLEVGRIQLKVTRVLESRPDEGFRFADLAPTLLINQADLDATGLVAPGSRVSYRMLFAGERATIENFKAELGQAITTSERLEDISDTSPQIRSAMDRSGRFLNLASLISVLLAAVAVAMAARRYAHRHRDRIALMKCMGASQGYVIRSSMLQLLMLAIGGALLGSVIGFTAQHGLAWLMRDMIGAELPQPGYQPVLVGVFTAVSILGGFALPDLWQMGRTSPMRVLRHDLDPPPLRYGIPWIMAVGSLVLLLLWLVRDTKLVLTILLGAGITFVTLGAAGWLLVRALRGFRGAGGVAWRYGLASVSRRGRESIVQLVAFGLGLMVLLLLTIVRNELLDNWRQNLPDNAPNQFLINIQTRETDALKDFLEERGIIAPELVPLVRARMTHINDADVTQMTFEDPEGDRWANRDSNLTWRATLQEDNRLVEGELWDENPEGNEVSVEQEFGMELGLKLGDELRFDIAGETVSATVTSFRTVEWDSFRPNFFMLFSPGVLDGYPATWISSLNVPADKQDVILEMMREFPSVTAIDLEATLSQVRDVMDKAALAVQAVFVFTLLAGLTVLWAAVQSTRDERRFESALLRTFGASRQRVLGGVATEFLAIGLLSGVLAASGASLAGYLLATQLFELEYQFSWALWLAGPIVGMLLVGLSGMAATWRVITHAPVNVLRTA
jgi:putative ABC transport system permease protein